jgi:short subunit dehydrogenase-like uncharacterized protein
VHAGAMSERWDVVLFGPTGVTGREVARHLARRAPEVGLSWAVAGRNRQKVEAAVADLASAPAAVLQADTDDAASIDRMVGSATVVANLVGPYARHGEVVYEACARRGVHELDLTGEIDWLARMIDAYQDTAAASGARIVPTAGFEALPFDLGMLLAARTAAGRAGEPVAEVDVAVTMHNDARISRPSDVVSGGTFASAMGQIADGAGPSLSDPYVLDPPGGKGRGRYDLRARRHAGTRRWLAPMVPSPFLNPPIAHRSAALLRQAGDPTFADGFRYREGLVASSIVPVVAPPLVAASLATFQAMFGLTARAPDALRRPVSEVLGRLGPKPGEGPRPEELDKWSYRLDIRATTTGGATADVVVEAAGHPGYKSTATMVGEAALILADPEHEAEGAGFLTPATALGTAALDRFTHAGATFAVAP